jgi:hypothetical protein
MSRIEQVAANHDIVVSVIAGGRAVSKSPDHPQAGKRQVPKSNKKMPAIDLAASAERMP